MPNSSQSHGMQHVSPPCPPPSPRACSNSCPLSQWCHPTISSMPSPSCPVFTLSHHQGLFPRSQIFTLGVQNIWVSASPSVLPMNIQDWFPLGLTCLISLQSKGLSRVFSNIIVWKHQFFSTQPFLWSNSHIYMTTGETIALTMSNHSFDLCWQSDVSGLICYLGWS